MSCHPTKQSSGRNEPTVTLAIVTMDRFELTVETLLQVDLTAFEEVIIVDDSTDTRLEKWCRDEPITYYRGPGINMQAARNVAIERCETDVIAFVDDDVLLPSDFADRLRTAYERNPHAAAIGGPPLSSAPSRARDLCYRERMAVSRFTGTVYDDSYRWVPEAPTSVGLLKGANMSFRRCALEEIGGFDLRYGGASQLEETDVCVRIKAHGELVLDPSLLCFHKQIGGSGFNQEMMEWRFRNHRYFIEKNYGLPIVYLAFISLFIRPCGNPDSILQLLFRKLLLSQQISIIGCLRAYSEGIN